MWVVIKQISLSKKIAVSVEGSKSIFYVEKPMLAQCKQAFPSNFVVRRFSVNGHVPKIVRRFARKSSETIRLQKVSRPGI